MDSSSGHPQASRERLLELDQSIRDSLDRGDGEAARTLAARQSRELRETFRRLRPEEAEAWLRETSDRMKELVRRAREARDALSVEISGLDIQRKLAGVPVAATGHHSGRSFRA